MLEASLDWFLLHIIFHYVITSEFGIRSSIACSKVGLMAFWKAALKCLIDGRSFQSVSCAGSFLSGASSLFAKCSAFRIKQNLSALFQQSLERVRLVHWKNNHEFLVGHGMTS